MGVVNCTPDSFFDGGAYDPIQHARRLIAEGVDWIDVGGESTRPNAPPVGEDEELMRVIPVIRAISAEIPVSIDTTRPAVARAALEAGARILNDIDGLAHPELAAMSADFWGVVVMHRRGDPRTMRGLTTYADLVGEVRQHLVAAAGRARCERVWIDPGIGFAKTPQQSLKLLQQLHLLMDTGYPVLVGASRKSFIGATLGLPDPAQRLAGSLAVACDAWLKGAAVLRVHDVADTRQALDLLWAIDQA